MKNKKSEITYVKMEGEINYYSSVSNEIRNKVANDAKYLIYLSFAASRKYKNKYVYVSEFFETFLTNYYRNINYDNNDLINYYNYKDLDIVQFFNILLESEFNLDIKDRDQIIKDTDEYIKNNITEYEIEYFHIIILQYYKLYNEFIKNIIDLKLL